MLSVYIVCNVVNSVRKETLKSPEQTTALGLRIKEMINFRS